MKSFFAATLCMAFFPAVFTGCSGDTPKPAPVVAPGLESFKAALGNVAATGEGGSGLESLRTQFAELQKIDAPKATSVESDLQALLKATQPEERKTLANKILQKL